MFERLHFNKKEKTTDIKTSPVLGEDPKPKTLEESERDERFEKIWEKPKRVILNFFSKDKGKKVESFDVYDMKSENPKTEVPLVVGLGWGELPKSWKKHVKYWTEHGRRVIIPDTPHGISTGKVKEDFPEIEIEKITALYETLLASGISIKEDGTVTGQVDLVGRSEGAIYSILLAYYYPQLVRNLVLENPAGLAGKTNMGIFAKRWHGQMTQKYEEDGAQPKDFMPNVVVKNPINALRSIKAISETDIRDMLKTIKANGAYLYKQNIQIDMICIFLLQK